MAEASFVDRIKHERLGIAFATNKACQTCIFAEGVVEWQETGSRPRQRFLRNVRAG